MAITAKTFTLQELFEKFSKFNDPKSDGSTITLSQSDKWMKQAEILGRKITMTDTGICFNKFKSRTICYSDYEKFLQDLAKTKQMDYGELLNKMVTCGIPGQPTAAQQAAEAAEKAKKLQYQ